MSIVSWREERIASTAVSLSDVRRFALALEDDNPQWSGESAIAPPTYILSAARPELWDTAPAEDGSLPTTVPGAALAAGKRILNGGCDVTIELDLQPGDVVTSVSELVSHEHKEGRSGVIEIIVVRTTYSCARGVLAVGLQDLVLR